MANPTETPDTPFQYIDCSSAVLKQEPVEHDEDETTPQQEASDSISQNANIPGGDSEFLDPLEEIRVKTEVIDDEDDQTEDEDDQSEDEDIGDEDIKMKQENPASVFIKEEIEIKDEQIPKSSKLVGTPAQETEKMDEDSASSEESDGNDDSDQSYTPGGNNDKDRKLKKKQGYIIPNSTYREENNLTCEICKTMLSSNYTLKRHMIRHSEPKYKCETCGKMFHFQDRLFDHQLKHPGTDAFNNIPVRYKCDTCDKRFYMKDSFVAHKAVHREMGPFVCKICHKSYSTISSHNRHKKLNCHSNLYTCKICNLSISSIGQLSYHYRDRHSSQELGSLPEHERNFPVQEYTCNFCKTSFHSKNYLILHGHSCSMKPPDNEEPRKRQMSHDCKLLDTKPLTPSMKPLNPDIKPVDLNRKPLNINCIPSNRISTPFACEVCGKTFNNKREIKTHIDTFCAYPKRR